MFHSRRQLHGRNLTKLQREALVELRRMLQLDEQSFSAGFDARATITTNEQANVFIREHTRLWRETWILPVLTDMIGDRVDDN